MEKIGKERGREGGREREKERSHKNNNKIEEFYEKGFFLFQRIYLGPCWIKLFNYSNINNYNFTTLIR
jgi:hypothetical protein